MLLSAFDLRVLVFLAYNGRRKQLPALYFSCDVFWNTVNFVGFSVIHVSQGSVATYVDMVESLQRTYSKFPAESDSERIFKIG